MSGSVLTMWNKGEIKKIKPLLLPELNSNCLLVPQILTENEDRNLYVEIKNNIITWEYPIWDQLSSTYCLFFIKEMAKLFSLKRGGWDAVGYCTSLDEFLVDSKGSIYYLIQIYEDTMKRVDENKKQNFQEKLNELYKINNKIKDVALSEVNRIFKNV